MAFQLRRLHGDCSGLCPDHATSGRCTNNFATYFAFPLALSFIVVSPALWCGLIGDDLINALTPEWVQTTYGSLHALILDVALNWAAIGRLQPISIAVTYTIWNYTYYDPAYAKLISLIGYLVCLGVIADFIRRFTTSARTALFFILLTTLCVQFRVWYDAILCFPLLVPLTLTSVVLQASLMHSFLKYGSPWSLCLAAAVLAVGLLSYELAFVALPIDLIILWAVRACRTRKIYVVAAIAGLFLAYFLLKTELRVPGATIYDGTALSLETMKVIRALAVNLFAAFPLTYFLLNLELVLRDRSLADLLTVLGISVAVAVGISFNLMWRKLTRLGQTSFINVSAMVLIGVCLLVVPAAMLAASLRYQNVVTKFGDVYIQALFEEIGLGILASCGINKVLTGVSGKPITGAWQLLGGFLALICAMTFVNNLFVVSVLNERVDKIGRSAFIKSMRNGVLDPIPDGSLLVFEGNRVWADPRLVRFFSRKLVSVKSGTIQDAELRCYANAYLVVIAEPLRRHWFDRDLQAAVSVSRIHPSSEWNQIPGLPHQL